jgi:uncharacterized linocin/CFP29 family protein
MDYLRRGSAPLSEGVWKALDEAVTRAARHVLSARRIATFDGPKGWDHLGTRLGAMRPCSLPEGKAAVCIPDIVPLAEIRADFSLPWPNIEVFERGAPTLDTRAVEAAAREVALTEDLFLFYGPSSGEGFLSSKESPHVQVGNWATPGQLLVDLLDAVELLDSSGMPGPYEALLSPAGYFAYLKSMSDGGYPAARQLERVLAGVHRSTVLREAGAVFSTRGGDFVITVGGDLSVGYRQHDRDAVHLMCVETIAGQIETASAVCLLAS